MLQRMELLISQPALHLKKPPVWHNSMRPHWKPCSALASEENLHLQDSFSVLVHVWLRPSIHPFSYFLILSKLIGHNYETVRFSAPYILFNPGSFFSLRNVWNPFPQIPPKPFFSPLLVYSYFTLDHTQLISLHLCVFKKKKRSYSCHHRGAHVGQVPLWSGTGAGARVRETQTEICLCRCKQ